MKQRLFIIFTLLTQSLFAANILPQPSSATFSDGTFAITNKTTLVYDRSARDAAIYLLDHLPFRQILSSDKVMSGDVYLGINRTLAEEEYRLTIDRNNIRIIGGSSAGVFYGVQTLLQMLPTEAYSKSLRLPVEVGHCQISDKPAMAYRGFMLEVARTWISADRVKRYIDLLAYHKFNKLHFHLTDDEGWRIELKSHPEFATIGGFRGGDSPVQPRYAKFDERWGGYYTQEELRDIVAYAASRNIEVIPEIDMPGHSKALGAIRSDILCNYTPNGAMTNNIEIRNVWCAAKEQNYKLIDEIVAELSTIFTSEYIHIGGDEVNMAQWRKCPDCQALKSRLGLENEEQIEDYFIARTTKILAKYGKKPAVWNEAIDGGTLPQTTRVYGWKNTKACRKAIERGYPTIVMPGEYFYLDMKQSAYEDGHIWAAIIDTKRILSFDLAKQGFTPQHIEGVAGIEASFFSELYIAHSPENNDYLDYMLFPRLCAVAELGWSGSAKRSWEQFYATLHGSHYDRMDAMGIAYRLFPPKVTYANGKLSATTDDGSTLYYTDTRTNKSLRYTKPFACDEPQYIAFESRHGKGRSPKAGSEAYHKRLTPQVSVTTSMPISSKTPLTNPAKYTNSIARTTRAARKGDWIEYRFAEAINCREITLQTGHVHLRRCLFLKGYVEICYDGHSWERVADLYDGGAKVCPTAKVYAIRAIATDRSDAEDNVVIGPLIIK